jgi:hypothetical protein
MQYKSRYSTKPWAVSELKQLKSSVEALPLGTKKGFALHHNWVNTPMEMGIADPEKAKLALVNAVNIPIHLVLL